MDSQNAGANNVKVDIRTDGLDADRQLHHLTRCCAAYELGPFRQRVQRVRVRLSTSPRGRDIGCAVQVDFFDRDSVVTAAADSNPYVAIHWAFERAGEAIARQLQASPREQRLADELAAAGSLPSVGAAADRAA